MDECLTANLAQIMAPFSEFVSPLVVKFDNILILGDYNIHVDDALDNFTGEFLSTTQSLS